VGDGGSYCAFSVAGGVAGGVAVAIGSGSIATVIVIAIAIITPLIPIPIPIPHPPLLPKPAHLQPGTDRIPPRRCIRQPPPTVLVGLPPLPFINVPSRSVVELLDELVVLSPSEAENLGPGGLGGGEEAEQNSPHQRAGGTGLGDAKGGQKPEGRQRDGGVGGGVD